jgi:hypothetical protein
LYIVDVLKFGSFRVNLGMFSSPLLDMARSESTYCICRHVILVYCACCVTFVSLSCAYCVTVVSRPCAYYVTFVSRPCAYYVTLVSRPCAYCVTLVFGMVCLYPCPLYKRCPDTRIFLICIEPNNRTTQLLRIIQRATCCLTCTQVLAETYPQDFGMSPRGICLVFYIL